MYQYCYSLSQRHSSAMVKLANLDIKVLLISRLPGCQET